MPVAFDMYVRKQALNIAQLGLVEEWPGLAFTRTGVWGGEMLRFITDCNSPSRLVQRLGAPFDVRVNLHDGGIGTVQKTLQKQQMKIVDLGRSPKEAYLAHLTCPVCADARGGDKILVARRWVASPGMQKRLSKQRAGAS